MLILRKESNRFVIRANILRADPKNIEINMENSVLSIKGEEIPSLKMKERDVSD